MDIANLMSPAAQAAQQTSSSQEPTSPSKKAQAKQEFEGTLAQAESATLVQLQPMAQAMAAAQAQPSQAELPKLVEKAAQPLEGSKATVEKGGVDFQKSALVASSAERSPTTQKSAVSTNTAKVIAGPKPWDKDWVFQGTEEAQPELRTLFDTPSKAPAPKEATQLQSLLQQAAPKASDVPGAKAQGTKGAQDAKTPRALAGAGAAQQQLLARETGSDLSMAANAAMMSSPSGGATAAREWESDLEGWRSEEEARPTGKSALTGKLSGSEFLDTRNNLGQPVSEPSNVRAIRPGQQPTKAKGISAKAGGNAGGEEFISQLGGANVAAQAGASQGNGQLRGPQPLEVTGHVTQGAMAKQRLSSESLMGVTSGLQSMTRAGGGEMRIRLNPDHLGEVHLRVTTRGRDVGVQIRASDEQAKRVIEESLAHLKENLASNSLNLARVDVSVGQPDAASGQFSQQQGGSDQGQQSSSFGSWMGQESRQQGHNQGRTGSEGGDVSSIQRSRATPPGRVMGATGTVSAGMSSLSATGRLNVMA